MRLIPFLLLIGLPRLLPGQQADALAGKQLDSLLNAAFVFTEQSKFDEALQINTAAEQFALDHWGRNSEAYAKACIHHGRIFTAQGILAEAEKWFLTAKELQQKVLGEQHVDYGFTLTNLATIYSGMGDYAAAEPLFLQAKAIWEKALGPENEYAGWSAHNLGTLYHRMQHFKKAEKFYEASNKLRRKSLGPDHPYYAATLCSQASLYVQTGEYAKAEHFYLEAKAIQGKALGKLHPDYAHTLDGLAILYDDYLKNTAMAAELYLEVMAIREQTLGKNHPDYGWSLGNMGSFYWYHGQYAQAEPLLLQAKELWANTLGKNYAGYAWSLHKLWALYWSMGDYVKAEKCATERNQLEKAELLRSAHYFSTEELSLFIRKFQDGLDEDYAFASAKGLNTGICYDNALFYKGFLLNTLSQLRNLALADPKSAAQYSALQNCERQLAMEYSKPLAEQLQISSLEETANQLEKDLAQRVDGFEEALRQVNWQEVQQKLQPGEIALEFIHYKWVNPRPTDSILYAALILSAENQVPMMVPLLEEKQLADLLNAKGQNNIQFINKLYGVNSESPLYTLIWAPIESALTRLPDFSSASMPQKTIYFAPSGLLHYLNLAALALPPSQQNQATNATLADRYHLIELGSTRQLVVRPTTDKMLHSPLNKPATGVLYGGIQYDAKPLENAKEQGSPVMETPGKMQRSGSRNADPSLRGIAWKYLKWTDVEALTIADLLTDADIPTTLLREYAASEESFKSLGTKGHSSPSILHLATHGFFYPEPGTRSKSVSETEPIFKRSNQAMIRAGLVLAGGNAVWLGNTGKIDSSDTEDGILTAYEISQMNLRNTELVVLSACETGLGDIRGNEGVYGLQRAFKIAGAKYLIMSLWQVPDFQTQELMTTFYSHWIEDKMSVPDAFQAAQKAMKEQYKDPFLWAGFVLVE